MEPEINKIKSNNPNTNNNNNKSYSDTSGNDDNYDVDDDEGDDLVLYTQLQSVNNKNDINDSLVDGHNDDDNDDGDNDDDQEDYNNTSTTTSIMLEVMDELQHQLPHDTNYTADDNVKEIIANSSNDKKLHVSLSQDQISKKINKKSKIPIGVKQIRRPSILPTYQLPAFIINSPLSGRPQPTTSRRLDEESSLRVENPIHGTNLGMAAPQHHLSFPDWYIPEMERKNLLRKFSVPMLNSSLPGLPHNSNKQSFPVSMSGIGIIKESDELSMKTNPNIEKHITDKLRCNICNNVLNDPRLLDCLHTFCFQCICDISTKTLNSKLNTKVVSSSGAGGAVGGGSNSRHRIENSERGSSASGTAKSFDLSFPKSISATSSIETENQYKPSSSTRSSTVIGGLFSSTRKSMDQKLKDRKPSSASSVMLGRRNSNVHHDITNLGDYIEIQKPIKCPTCSYMTTIPFGGIHRLQQNFIITRKIKEALCHLGREFNSTIAFCNVCYNDATALAFCLTCNTNLCNFCKEAHQRQRATSMHDIRYLSDLQTQFNNSMGGGNSSGNSGGSVGGSGIINNFALKCSIHPTHELKLFCLTCQQIACSSCTILLHRGHKCEPAVKASREYKKRVKLELERTRPLIDCTNDSISKLNSIAKKINQRAEMVQTDVNIYLAEYLEALEAHRSILHKQIARARERKMFSIAEQKLDLSKRCSDAKTAIEFADDVFSAAAAISTNGGSYISGDLELLQFAGILLNRFEYCQKSKVLLDPKVTDTLTFLPHVQAPSTIDQHNIPVYGIITTQVAIPKLCAIDSEGLMFLRVHRKVEVTMVAKDVDENPLCHGGLKLNVLVKYKDISGRIVATDVSDNRDGTYLITFIPEAAGALTMTITIQDKHIKGSPFMLCARTLRPHSGIFHCCAFCSGNASKSTICACKCIMPGGYKGCGHGHDGHPGRRHWSCCASDLENSECSATNAFR